MTNPIEVVPLIEGMARALFDHIQKLDGQEPCTDAEWSDSTEQTDIGDVFKSQIVVLEYISNNTTPAMVEVLARQLCVTDGDDPDAEDEDGQFLWEFYEELAELTFKAAIAAAMEENQ